METSWVPQIEAGEQPLYVEITKSISNDIANGRLKDNDKLPTQRELADRMGIAIGTVTRAYAEAERRGLIRGEGRRGTYVGKARSGRSILSAMARLSPEGIDLSKNHPLYSLDPDLRVALRHIARRKNVQQLLEYPPAGGLSRHREAGAAWFRQLGAEADPKSVFVTAGAQHSLSVILAGETKPGDTIAAEEFTYPGIKALAEQRGVNIEGVPCDDRGMLPDSLETLCRKRKIRMLYCNPTLQNPTNLIWTAERRREIVSIADRHGIGIIDDEILTPLMTEHPGFISCLRPERSFLVISASKAVAAGLRVGFVLAPKEARDRMIESLNVSCLGGPPLTAEVLADWLDDGTVDRVIKARRKDIASRQKIAGNVLRGLVFTGHPSSYHVWLKLPEGWSGMRLAMEAQSKGVKVTPAEAFAMDDRRSIPAVRLSLVVAPTEDVLKSGLTTVADILSTRPGRYATRV